jgi:hypothetical protein
MVFSLDSAALWQSVLDAYDVTFSPQIIGEAWRGVDKCPQFNDG